MSNIVVCKGEGALENQAEEIAQNLGLALVTEPGSELTLLVDKDGVTLMGYGLSFRGDFENMLRRVTNGRVQHEMIARLVKTKEENPTVIDATAGMGEDSILLAACGYKVTMFEQNPVIAELLKDAMRRAKNHPELGPLMERMTLIQGNSIEIMPTMERENDIIFLDPMFPARQKSGLINKKLQLIQKLEQPCLQEEELLDAAIKAKPKKIIIKRPLKGSNLAGRRPSYSIKGKAIRYDCIVL